MSLKRQALSGTAWTTASAGTRALIQILRLAILTRFLPKSDFGLVAIVVLVLGFTHIFTDLGVSVSLFSKQQITQKEYSSLYWVSILLSFFLYGCLLIMSPLVAGFYHLPVLNDLIPVMGLELIFAAAGRQFRIFREKALQFKTLAIIDILSLFISLVVAVLLAMEGAGVYSLIISALFTSFTAGLMLIITGYKSHPLIFYINIREGKGFYRIGFYQTGSQIFDYIASQLDILIIGKLMPTSELGVYNLVKQLILRVYGTVNPIVTQVAVPILASIQADAQRLKDKYLQMIHIIAFVNFGFYGLIALLAREILFVLYGPAYQDASSILQLLCIWGSLAAIGSAVNTIVIFKGRTDLGFYRTLLRVFTNPVFIVVGSFYGLVGITLGQAFYAVLFFGMNWRLLIHNIMSNISFREYANNALPFLFISVGIFIALFLLKDAVPGLGAWMNLFIWGVLFVSGYLFFTKKTVVEFCRYILVK